MKYKIVNTENEHFCSFKLDGKYLKKVEEIFGEVETREVYDNINDTKPTVEYYIDVKSVEQLQELIRNCDQEIVIKQDEDVYTFIQEVNKYVWIEREEYPKIWVIEIYDDWRE